MWHFDINFYNHQDVLRLMKCWVVQSSWGQTKWAKFQININSNENDPWIDFFFSSIIKINHLLCSSQKEVLFLILNNNSFWYLHQPLCLVQCNTNTKPNKNVLQQYMYINPWSFSHSITIVTLTGIWSSYIVENNWCDVFEENKNNRKQLF